MKIDFEDIITNRKKFLNNKILQLDQSISDLQLSSSIKFCIADIQPDYNPRKKGKKVGIEQLNFLEKIKTPIVYIFEIIDKSKIDIVKKEFRDHRLKRKSITNIKERRALSYLPTEMDSNESSILYVGSMKKDFHRRIKQHLGLGNHQTGAMNLKYWLPKDIKLNLYFIIVDNPDLTYDIEAAVAKEISPLIGRCEK